MCPQTIIKIETSRIADESSLHDLFAEVFGFPSWAGRNWDAWIDCMSCLDRPEDGMTAVHVGIGDVLVLYFDPPGELKERLPKAWDNLVEAASFVNWSKVAYGENALLALAL